VVEDRELLRHAEKVLQMYEGLSVEPSDCVLVHSDVGLHNVAVDDVTDAVNGIFDYHGAAWADRQHDFRYLVFDFGEDNLLEAACPSMSRLSGRAIPLGADYGGSRSGHNTPFLAATDRNSPRR
jgi:aminoglycoside phosphotransferase (APT) family kinase protein